MALVNLLFAPTSLAYIGNINLDVSEEEEYGHKCTITKNPLESGGQSTTGIYLEPTTISIVGEITDTPVRLLSGVRGIIEGKNSGGLAGGRPNGFIGEYLYPDGDTRSINAYNAFLRLRESRTAITVLTGLGRFPNMLIEDFKVKRSATIGRSLRVTLSLQTAKFVELKQRQVDLASKNRANTQGQKKKERGKQDTRNSNDSESSFMFDALDAVFGG